MKPISRDMVLYKAEQALNAISLTMAFAKRRPKHLHLIMPEDIASSEKCTQNKPIEHNQATTKKCIKDEQKPEVPKKVTFAINTMPERKTVCRTPSPHPNKRSGYKNAQRNIITEKN